MNANASTVNTVSRHQVWSFVAITEVHLSIKYIFIHSLITVYVAVFVQ